MWSSWSCMYICWPTCDRSKVHVSIHIIIIPVPDIPSFMLWWKLSIFSLFTAHKMFPARITSGVKHSLGHEKECSNHKNHDYTCKCKKQNSLICHQSQYSLKKLYILVLYLIVLIKCSSDTIHDMINASGLHIDWCILYCKNYYLHFCKSLF